MSSTIERPRERMMEDVSRDPEPYVICVFEPPYGGVEPIAPHLTLNEVIGEFPDEHAALSYLDEHGLGGDGSFLYIIQPVRRPAEYASAIARGRR